MTEYDGRCDHCGRLLEYTSFKARRTTCAPCQGVTVKELDARPRTSPPVRQPWLGGPNTRSTQLYFNLVDNTPRLDTLNGSGFPPIGRIVEGLAVLDYLNWEYSGTRGGQLFPGPAQDSIRILGNAYLRRTFPRLDYIVRARVTRRWR